jgi:hypothetical protein
VPVVGTVLVASFGLLIDAINIIVDVISRGIDFVLDFKEAFIGLGTALLGAKVLGAIQSVTASITAAGGLKAGLSGLASFVKSPAMLNPWTVLAAAGVAAAVLIIDKFNETQQVLEDTKDKLLDNVDTMSSSIDDLTAKGDQASLDLAEHIRGVKAETKALEQDLGFKWQDIFHNPFRARGGPIESGKPYIVGEEGPELIVPRSSGTVITAPETSKIMSSQKASNNNITVYNTINQQVDIARMVRDISWAIS